MGAMSKLVVAPRPLSESDMKRLDALEESLTASFIRPGMLPGFCSVRDYRHTTVHHTIKMDRDTLDMLRYHVGIVREDLEERIMQLVGPGQSGV